MAIETVGEVRPYNIPGKDHDRMVLSEDDERQSYVAAVFDGANTAWASDIAKGMLEEMAERPDFSVEPALDDVQRHLLFKGNLLRLMTFREPYMTTAAVVHVKRRHNQLVRESAVFGDAVFMEYDADVDKLTVTTGRPVRTRGFLGHWRPKRYADRASVPVVGNKTFVIATDGLYDRMNMTTEMSDDAMKEILADPGTEAAVALKSLIGMSNQRDDVAIAMMRISAGEIVEQAA